MEERASSTEGQPRDVRDLTLRLTALETAVTEIRNRNLRVEIDKQWETSVTRFVGVALITYVTMNLILWTIGSPFPPLHAIVPTCGYMLSTLSLRFLKHRWVKQNER